MKTQFLEGSKIYLSPFTKQDISEEYVSWLNDREVSRYNSHAIFPNSLDKALKYIEAIENSQSEVVFAIRWKKNNEHIGNASIQKINWVYKSGELAILIGNKKYWNKGVGSEVYNLIIEYGFDTLNLNRIYSGQTVSNNGMVKVCEKSGMKKEGIFREALYKHGEYVDTVIYSILHREYSKNKKKK